MSTHCLPADNRCAYSAKNQRSVRIVDIRTFRDRSHASKYIDEQLKIGRACQKEVVGTERIHQVKTMELI